MIDAEADDDSPVATYVPWSSQWPHPSGITRWKASVMKNLLGPALAAAAAIGAVIAVQPRPGGAATGPRPAKTLSFTLRAAPDRDEAAIDNGPDGPSLGDAFIAADRIYDGDNHRRLGRANGICLTTGLEHGDNQCSGTFYLPQGKIEWATGDDGPPRLELAITGGFGRYAGARGTAIVTPLDPNANRSRLIIHLEP